MITVNLDKAKNIAHEIRRNQRSKEFQPYDEVIMKQIPGVSATEAEASRQAIREKYAEIQDQIDNMNDPYHLSIIVKSFT
jgi:hypothetical protein